jgi:TrmH family RNA methyltransferase
VAEAAAARWPLVEVYLGPGVGDDPAQGAVPVVRLAEGVIEHVATTVTPQPVLALARRRVLGPGASLGDFVVAGAQLADPGNLGTILRSAEAAGASAVALLPGSVDAFNPKVVRASAGALFRVPVADEVDLDQLRDEGRCLVGTSSHAGTAYDAFDWRAPVTLVLGNEAHGLPLDLAVDELVTIPHAGTAESLNVAMAATVLCFEVARQRHRS